MKIDCNCLGRVEIVKSDYVENGERKNWINIDL